MTIPSLVPHRGLAGRIREFFYGEEVPYGLALMRITLPLIQLAVVLPRWWHARELYSSDGVPTPLWVSYGLTQGLPIPSATIAVVMMSLLVVLLMTASAGWFSRCSMGAAAALFTYLSVLDCNSTLDKCVCICVHAMFLLSMSSCGEVWSVDAWLRGARDPAAAAVSPRFPAWPRRLLQLLIGIIYIGAAATKLHTPGYFSGDQMLCWMLTDLTGEHPLGKQLSLHPALLPLTAYVTLIWEIAFIFLAWRGYGRACMLGVGVLFHSMTWALLGLSVFPLTYMCFYLAWINERDIARVSVLLRRFGGLRTLPMWIATAVSAPRRLAAQVGPIQSATAFSLVLAATAFTGVELERRGDVYGELSAGGPPTLQRIPAGRVAELLSQDSGLRAEDKVFSFELGSFMLGEYVADRRREFDYGDDAVVQCSLTPPHEDLWVEFNLVDAEGRVVSRHGQIVAREQLRTSHSMTLNRDLPAGDYAWVLRLDGRDVATRSFTLGAVQTAAAEAPAVR